MIPPKRGVRSGRALKVDLSSGSSGSENRGCSREGLMCERQLIVAEASKGDLVAWTRVNILLRVNF